MKHILLLVILLLAVAGAEELYLDLGATIYKNGTVQPGNMELVPEFLANHKPMATESGDYSLTILDENEGLVYAEYFDLYFYISSVPNNIPTDSDLFYTSVPYDGSFHSIEIWKGAERLYATTLPVFCDDDRVCDVGENHANCPVDCLASGSDDLCERFDDGICDPDCFFGRDLDCPPCGDGICEGSETEINCPPDCKQETNGGTETDDPNLGIMITVIVLFLVFGYLILKRRGKTK